MKIRILSRSALFAFTLLTTIGVCTTGIAATLTNGAIVGPFIAGTGHWTPVPHGEFEENPGPVANSTWYTGSSNLIFITAAGASGSGSIVAEAAESGHYGVSIKPGNFSGPGVAVAYDGLLPVISGHSYVLSAFVKRLHPAGSKAHVYLDLWTGDIGADATTNTTEWQFVYSTFIANGSTTSARAVVDSTVSTTDEVYVDSLAITPSDQFVLPQVGTSGGNLPSGTNFIQFGPFVRGSGHWNTVPNGDFESGATNLPISGYTGAGNQFLLVSTGSSGTASINQRAAEYGQYGVEIDPGHFSGSGLAVTYNGIFHLTPGHVYVLSAFVRRPNPEASLAHIYLDLWAPPGIAVPSTNSTADWQFIYGTFTATTAPVTTRAIVDFNVNVSDVAYFDEIAITPVEEFVPPTTGPAPAQAQATAQIDGGYLTDTIVIAHGAGYTNTPSVLIDGGGGNGATAIPVMVNGTVDHLIITSAGSGYTNPPTIYIGKPTAGASLSIAVSKVKIALYLVPGKRYVVQESNDLHTWNPLGPPFTATAEIQVQEFEAGASANYFEIVESTN